jgi:hypothetical protein
MKLTRRMSAASAASILALAVAAPGIAAAGDYCYPPPPPPEQKDKCNAGNGNGSDAVSFVEGAHCYGGDPGNSFNAGNRGGDEIPTTVPQGGVPNPGGNNDPGTP